MFHVYSVIRREERKKEEKEKVRRGTEGINVTGQILACDKSQVLFQHNIWTYGPTVIYEHRARSDPLVQSQE